MNFEQLINAFEQTHEYLQNKAVSAINQSLTIRNWLFGYYIVAYEQNGEDRAKYGIKLLKSIADRLKKKGIIGSSERNIRNYRQFYYVYPQVGHALSGKSIPESIWQTASAKLKTGPENIGVKPEMLITKLSFSHIIELTREEETLKRAFYEIHAIKGNWSVDELKRQMGSLLYERTGLSKNKEKLIRITNEKATELNAADIIRDPYIFEFLGLKQREVIKEEKLEELLLDHLQEFLLELGKGFCFEARQKRITVDDEYNFIDLVFYHRILKCHVLIDLKTKKFVHSDASQMNFYLNYFKDNEMVEGDKEPIGLLLCTKKGESTVKYALSGIDNRLFVSQYSFALPSEEELKAFIEKNRKLLDS